jgi:hypothetical protein
LHAAENTRRVAAIANGVVRKMQETNTDRRDRAQRL